MARRPHGLANRPDKPHPATFRVQVAGPGIEPGGRPYEGRPGTCHPASRRVCSSCVRTQCSQSVCQPQTRRSRRRGLTNHRCDTHPRTKARHASNESISNRIISLSRTGMSTSVSARSPYSLGISAHSATLRLISSAVAPLGQQPVRDSNPRCRREGPAS